MSLSKMSTLGNLNRTWGPINIGRHNFSEIKVEIQIAFILVKDGFQEGGTTYKHIMTLSELKRLARYTNQDGTFESRPGFPRDVIKPVFAHDPTASQATRTLAIDEHKILMQAYLYQMAMNEINTAQITATKNFFMDPIIWGRDIARIAAGPQLSAVTDLPLAMWTRILEVLDRLDDAATAQVTTFYKTPHQGIIAEFQTEEKRLHRVLLASGREFTDTQCMQAARTLRGHRPEVQRVLALFDDNNPDDAQRAFAALNAHLLALAPYIKRHMPATAMYPAHQAAAATASTSVLMCPWEHKTDTFVHTSLAASSSLQQQAMDGRYTQAQIDEHAFKAIADYMRTNPSAAGLETMLAIGQRYCHVHGFGTHTGLNCGSNKKGCKTQYWRADSCAGPGGIDKTRVIGHENQ
jgi:hypothetical protein